MHHWRVSVGSVMWLQVTTVWHGHALICQVGSTMAWTCIQLVTWCQHGVNMV
jgi:hypothetical protein